MSNIVETGEKHDIKIERSIDGDAGDFTGGGWKLVWHTTESPVVAVDSMVRVLHDKGAEPHFCFGKRDGRYVAVQMCPLNQAARTLQHPAGTPETNRANAIQVEICGRASESGLWTLDFYESLANLTRLINVERRESGHRMVPWDLARSFANDTRFTGLGFIEAEGHLGHKHAPNQPSGHSDPGDGFKGGLLMQLLRDVPDRGYYLLNG